ncbi:MAG: hypothetical protein H6Q68_138 [Firmicutes bacterium]|nr:hypothetical protein [Bacillota bacterium]
MEQWEKASCCLRKKMELLEKIAVNTEAQYRFIHRREMKGLKRVFGEREILIRKLVAINLELSKDQTWKNIQRLAPLIQEISHKGQEIIDRSHQAMQEAIAERTRIAAELKSSRVRQQVKNQYINPWAIVAHGRRFNEKG